ncbi:MAG: ABC transporter permease, partial [Candidatus Micrarchaeaceae archaeon]
ITYSALSLLLTLITMFIVAISVVSIGLIIGSFMNSTEGFGLISGFVIFPLFFLSGALFPTNNLPAWLGAFVGVNPLTYAVDLLRGLLLGIHTFNLWLDFTILAGFAIVMVICGTLAFRRLKP